MDSPADTLAPSSSESQVACSQDGDGLGIDGTVNDDDGYSYDPEAEWEESKAQMNTLLSMVIFPFVCKWIGRKCAFWGKSDKKKRGGMVLSCFFFLVAWSRWSSSYRSFDSSSFLSMQWLNVMKRIPQ